MGRAHRRPSFQDCLHSLQVEQRENEVDWTWPADCSWPGLSVREGRITRQRQSLVSTLGRGNRENKQASSRRVCREGLGRWWTLECVTGTCNTETAWRPALLCAATGICQLESRLSLLPEVRKMAPFGRRKPVSQLPEECWFL